MSGTVVTRRAFLQAAATGGAALAIAVHVPRGLLAAAEDAGAELVPGAFLRVDAAGQVTVTVARSELGQGARTVVPMLVAEELEADWARVRVESALAHPQRYGSMVTGGSSTVRGGWEPLRKAGAAAREMLVAAAAGEWGVPAGDCHAEQGVVVHGPTGRRLPYGHLVAAASRLPVPQDPPLKHPASWRLIGTSPARLDTPGKVWGTAQFGLDVAWPGLLVAVVARSPVLGGTARGHDDAGALAVPGVRAVQAISSGVAVVADATWAALRGREALRVEWDPGPHAALDSAAIRAQLAAAADGEARVVRDDGDTAAALAAAARRIDAEYEVPFLAHAPLEPMNCVADVRADEAQIWAPTQSPQWVQRAVAGVTELPPERVAVHTTLTGGGFGRRLMWDYAVEAAELSRRLGKPVKVVWTRDDDMRHGYFRPASLHRLAAGLDAQGRLTAWGHRVAAPSIMRQVFPQAPDEGEPDAVDGAIGWPYAAPHVRVEYAPAPTPVPVTWWRSVYNTQNAFANECFLDEVAQAAGTDPLALRLGLLPPDARLRAVLQAAADAAGWGAAGAAGRGRGLAAHTSFGSHAATVVEASAAGSAVRVHRVVTALDCGVPVHPDAIRAQVEGAAVMALAAALHGEITVRDGGVEQRNFDDYPILTLGETPVIEVVIVAGGEPVGGVGEPGLPPVAPALCNAIFAATGRRVRRLPVRL